MTPAIPKPRSHYLDTLKVGAIFLVCFYHAALLDLDVIAHHTAPVYAHFFLEAFASVAIPLFFMVNGALLLNRDLNLRRHLGKTVSLYFLIFIWGAITLYGQAIIRGEHYSPSGFVWALWELKPGRINHLWFLNAIVMIYLLRDFDCREQPVPNLSSRVMEKNKTSWNRRDHRRGNAP